MVSTNVITTATVTMQQTFLVFFFKVAKRPPRNWQILVLLLLLQLQCYKYFFVVFYK